MRISLGLTAIVMVAFFGLLLLGAFAGPLLATPVWGAVPLSFVLGFAFIVGVVLLTGLYAWGCNAAETRS